ncbi:MAG: hypothetical protein NZ555_05610 [Geminicoccaceae bacterium]|nr:hypothetical protein [Geminicoccaceae bacterium]MCX8102423.1 hypothetical protein [Geminicoccaceae bacterium]MDW8370815.1 hypothetical protein [Geminicoccaceae bacterium]
MARSRLVLLLLLVLGACAPITEPLVAPAVAPETTLGAAPRIDGGKVLLLPPDVECGEVGASGLVTPRADWTEQAMRNVTTALEQKLGARNLVVERLDEATLLPDERAAFERFAPLARTVGLSIFHFQNLPGRAGRFDWTVGETGKPLRAARKADHALLVHLRDSHATAEAMALNALSIAAAVAAGAAGVRAPVRIVTGAQVGFATLVELESGRVVWFNRLGTVAPDADLRVPASAEKSVDALLAACPI